MISIDRKSEDGITLLGVMVTVGLFGFLVVVTMTLLSNYANQSAHIRDRGLIEDVHTYIYNSVSCAQTLHDQRAQCNAGGFVTVRDHIGRTLIQRPPNTKYYDKGVGLRTRCKAEDGFFVLESEYHVAPLGQIYKDRLTGKEYDWQPLNDSVGFTCSCIPPPIIASVDKPPTAPYPGPIRQTFYFANVAVDPGGTGIDAAVSHGLTPFPLSPATTLGTNYLSIPTGMLNDFILNQGLELIEYTAFTHQFLMGLDRVRIDFKAGPIMGTTVSPANIYSSYGYVQISALKVVNGVPRGTVSMHAFGHDTGGTALGVGSPQDATNLIRPMVNGVTPSRVFTNIDLRDFLITIYLYANTYDSVQYRAIRGNMWLSNPMPKPVLCR